MEKYLCIFLFVGCLAQNVKDDKKGVVTIESIIDKKPNILPSILDKTERPCEPFDMQCIRRYFKDHAQCKPVKGGVPEPLYRPQSNVFYPSVNITKIAFNVEYKGLNGRVEEFFVNRETDRLVIAIEFRGLTFTSKDTFFRYHRRGREPIVTAGEIKVRFNSIIVTTTIPQINHLKLKAGESFGFSNDLAPEFNISKSLYTSSDPAVEKMFAAFLLNARTVITEFLLTEASFYATTFIQQAICDFGIKVL